MAKPNSAGAKSGGKITNVVVRSRREHIAAVLRSRFALRIHTSILLLWMFSAGLLTTKSLFALGVHSMFARYLIAIVVAYGAFLLGVRVWLAYVGAGATGTGGAGVDARRTNGKGENGSIDLPDFLPSGRSSGGGSSGVFSGGGGSSGGGGASASFGGGAAPPSNLLAMDSAALSASNSGSGGGSGGDSGFFSDVGGKVGDVVGDIGGGDGDGCLIAFAVMIVIGLVALAIGGAVFVISAGPEILIDAAFEALLAGGLIKATGRMHHPDWFGSVVRATWVPLAVVLALATAFAFTAAALVPQAKTFGEVTSMVMPLLLEKL